MHIIPIRLVVLCVVLFVFAFAFRFDSTTTVDVELKEGEMQMLKSDKPISFTVGSGFESATTSICTFWLDKQHLYLLQDYKQTTVEWRIRTNGDIFPTVYHQSLHFSLHA